MPLRLATLPIIYLFIIRLFCSAQDVQKRAEELMNRAHSLGDIRSADAPSFRLKATFSFTAPDLRTVEGSYTEVWVSESQWYRETVVGDHRRIEVCSKDKRWLKNSPDLPKAATRITGLMQFAPHLSSLEFESVSERTDGNLVAECAITKKADHQPKSAFCFEKSSGILVERVSSEVGPRNVVDYSCSYGTFRKFEQFWFPWEITCYKDRHHDIDVRVLELSIEKSPDPALFLQPPGAIELANCSTTIVPAVPVSSPSPMMLSGPADQGWVTVELLVDVKGKPQDLQISRSGGKRFDEEALSAVRSWRFKPATCNGKAVPSLVDVEVQFQLVR